MAMKEDSRVARIAALEVDESHLEGVRLKCSGIEHGVVKEAVDRIRNNVKAAVRRAAENTGHQYTIEGTSSIIGGEYVLATVAVTRWN